MRVGLRGRVPPHAGGLIHPLRVWIEQKVEEGRICPSAPASLSIKLASSHLLSSGPQAPRLGVTHTTCFLGPQAANSSSWDFSASVITGAKASQ